MSWRTRFESKKTTATEAAGRVRSGQRVFVGSGCAQPRTLVGALAERGVELRDVEVVHLLTLGHADYCRPGLEDSFRHNAFFIGANTRQAVNEGRADYTPIFLSEIPGLMRSGRRRVDVACLSLSPPDRHGWCSMGIHVDIQTAALEGAKLVLAEINPHMPRTHGDTLVHADRVDGWIPEDKELLTLDDEPPADVAIRIGGQVARLIDNGSCLQLGIGAIPNALLGFLEDKRDLGVHTEMFSDGILSLCEGGVVTNKKKSVMAGKTVTSFCMGSKALYDFVDDNPSISFHPSDFVNDPRVISQNDRVVAINSALQVDLTGQVAADSVGYQFYSGIGGQVDFIRGAAMSRGGKPIIALPSTAKDGAISRIVPHLDEGTGVVTSRGDVHYVVTEYGVAYLHGKNIRERAIALINIAHPDVRADLLSFVSKRHYVREDEAILKQSMDRYPQELDEWVEFGPHRLRVRPLRGTDERHLQEFFYSHRPDTVYTRYFNTKTAMGHREAAELCCVDYERRMALAVFESIGLGRRLVAVARYELNPRTNIAETAVVVHEEFRRLGIASHLQRRLAQHAKRVGIAGFTSEIMPENTAMLGLHRRLKHRVVFDREEGVYRVTRRFDEASTKRPVDVDSSDEPRLDAP
ncbi:MAG: GNAT family N-acetyltransferase [Myxococcota bacterium]